MWNEMRQALKPGGWTILEGDTPDQRRHHTGGPSDPANPYTEDLLHADFWDFEKQAITKEATALNEGRAMAGQLLSSVWLPVVLFDHTVGGVSQ